LMFKRRSLLEAGILGAAATLLPLSSIAPRGVAATESRPYMLRPAKGEAHLLGAGRPGTAVWCYNGRVPGPEIRIRRNKAFRAQLQNTLSQNTTIHWHGLRVPHAMDGVPDLTQLPVPPGEAFLYEFEVPDAGTFWYHPHVRGSEQQGRGLYGPLIVEEEEPPLVDREAVWVIDDWRLDDAGAIHESFGNGMDLSHAGRLGNVATLNGQDSTTFALRAGERVRLRLINTANARIFALRFEGHRPLVIALDGQPAVPHEPERGVVVLPPAGRADIVLDAEGDIGGSYAVRDVFYPQGEFRFLNLVYSEERPLRESPLDSPVALAANPIPEPRLGDAKLHQILLAGGAMGGLRSATLDRETLDIRTLAQRGKVWAINGIVSHRNDMEPLLVFDRGRTQLLEIKNDTAFPHPMHLHGHSFRLIARNGSQVPHAPWLDTVLLAPEDRIEVAFVADNPGDWLFHCHVLEHMEAGMAAVFRVT